MSLGPEVIPAPRVMAVNKFVRRFNYVLTEPPVDGALVQLWAVAHGLDENGDEVLLVAHSIIGDRDEAIDHMSMKKSSKALQYLDAKFVLGDAGVEIAAVCFAIATVLDVSDDE